MFDPKIPSTTNMDQTPAISTIATPGQQTVIYKQPVPVCVVETGTCQYEGSCFHIPCTDWTYSCLLWGGRLVDSPSLTICPSCRENVTTRVSFNSGRFTWLLCVAIMFFGFAAGCCLIPFCINATKDVDHFCPRCDCRIFKYKRL
ncbi:lipopolysaccharide-induced tumor necrosis factor-alpha factor homolog isoform X2 [Dendrobates tinctorius]|uniref:lipopolysaccharide-induced tumor necrosis factor-alpha factor homolog isoform X2 n=1 Tax=Dendrobates tinctorius TaxID=92724 RepID=UPI003CCA1F53